MPRFGAHALPDARPALAAAGQARQRLGGLARLPELLGSMGVDARELLAQAGLPANALDSPEGSIGLAALDDLLGRAIERTGCAELGLRMGQSWRLADLGLIGAVARHAPTVGEALRMLSVFHQLNSEGSCVYLVEHGATAEMGYMLLQPGLRQAAALHDCALAVGHALLRELCGPAFRLEGAHFAHRPPPGTAPYRELMRAPLRFETEVSCLIFGARWLRQPIAGADAGERARLQQQADAAEPAGLPWRVARALRLQMLHGPLRGDDVAQVLQMHRRQLNRRLQARGTTFQAELDAVRFEVARQLLAGTRLSLDDVAAHLGYAGASPFVRAFRRWSGMSPGRWRAAAGTAAAAD